MANEQSKLHILIDIQSRLAGLEAAVAQMSNLRAETAAAATSAATFQSAIAGFAGGFAYGALQQLTATLASIPGRFVAAAAEGVRFNATLESAQLGIAAIVKQFDQSGRIKSFDDAMRTSSGALDLLKQKAKETSATFEELVQGFQANAGPLFKAGIGNAQQQVEVVVAASQALAAMDIPTNQLNQELRAIFQGDVSRNSRLNQTLEITKEQIDAAVTSGTAYELIMERLGAFSEAGARAQGALNTRLSNFTDIMTDLKAVGTTELFGELRKALGDINTYLSRPETAEAARGLGLILAHEFEEATKQARAFVALVQDIGGLFGNADPLGYSKLLDEGRLRQFNEEQAKQLANLKEQAAAAVTLEQRDQARTKITQRVVALMERETGATGEMRAALRDAAADTAKLGAGFGKIVGTSLQAARNVQDIVKALDEAQTKSLNDRIDYFKEEAAKAAARAAIDNQLATASARAAGAPSERAEQRRQELQGFLLRATIAYGEVTAKTLTVEYEAHLKAADGAAVHKEALRAIHEEIRKAGEQENLVSDDPFRAAGAKNAELIPILREEARLHREAGDEARAHAIELRALSLSFGSGLQADLADWVNSFGTSAHQIGQVIQGTINAALQGTNQLLIDAVFQTGDWRQTLVGVERQILNLFLTWIEQMALQRVAELLGITTKTGAQVAANATTTASAAPAAVAQTGASSGSNWIIGAAAAAVAIGAIIAAMAGAFHEGGVPRRDRSDRRGRRGPLQGDEHLAILLNDEVVLTREQAAQTAIIGDHSVFTAGQVAALTNIPAHHAGYAWVGSKPKYDYGYMWVRTNDGSVLRIDASGNQTVMWSPDPGAIEPGTIGGVDLPAVDLEPTPASGVDGPRVEIGRGGRPIPADPEVEIGRGGRAVPSGPSVEFPRNVNPVSLGNPTALPWQAFFPTYLPNFNAPPPTIARPTFSADIFSGYYPNSSRGIWEFVDPSTDTVTPAGPLSAPPRLVGGAGATLPGEVSGGAEASTGSGTPRGTGRRGRDRNDDFRDAWMAAEPEAPPAFAHDINSPAGWAATYGQALAMINAPGAPNKFWTPDERGATIEPTAGGSAYNLMLAARLAGLSAAQRQAILRNASLSSHMVGGLTTGSPTAIAGIVHGREYVEPMHTVEAYGPELFEAFRQHRIPVRAAQELLMNHSVDVPARSGMFDEGGLASALPVGGAVTNITDLGAPLGGQNIKVHTVRPIIVYDVKSAIRESLKEPLVQNLIIEVHDRHRGAR